MDDSQNQQPDETTPLIAVVHVRQPPPRLLYRHSRVRRLCSFCLGSLLVLFLVAAALVLILVPDCERGKRNWRNGGRHGSVCLPNPFWRHDRGYHVSSDAFTYQNLVGILQSTPNETKIREWTQYYTSGPHLGGKNRSQAEWTRDRWVEFGVNQTELVDYEVFLNYPIDHRLALLKRKKKGWKMTYEASLKEDILPDDPTSALKDRIPTFHGYSASGNVTAPFIFVNYGTKRDFEDLVAANVSLNGTIAIARYGKIFRGLKVKAAQEHGMIGTVIYSDPGDDGNMTEANGEKTYPDGPARHPSSVQRGSVQFISTLPGDPTTPLYPSKPGCKRQSINGSVPEIPSLPISYLDAIPILQALKGHGPKAKELGGDWDSGGLGYKDVEYWVGPTPDNVAINLYNQMTPDDEYHNITNVIGIINGTINDEVIILGNHRDAWIAGGAGDPNSGSAALNEVIRSFGVALAQGWTPQRTLIFASWDAEEYGLVGSTEWVEEYALSLNKTVIAYLNVDVGTVGPHFKASASPLLNKALRETTMQVMSPNQTVQGQTMYDVWDKHIATLGSGSDYTAFQDFLGIPSIDMGFGPGPDTPVYQYHSNYDSFHWMENFGDPGFHYHATIAKLWGLLAARLSEPAVLSLNTTEYARDFGTYLQKARDKFNETKLSIDTEAEFLAPWGPLDVLNTTITKLQNATKTFDAEAAKLGDDVQARPIPWWKWWERVKRQMHVTKVNQKLLLFDRQFLFEKGLDGRPFFKHIVFAPGINTGYAGETFPGIIEAIEEGNKTALWKWTGICTGLVDNARKWIEE